MTEIPISKNALQLSWILDLIWHLASGLYNRLMHIIGHHKTREMLRKSVHNGHVSQSYLFSGPEGIGKSLCALEFGAALAGKENFHPTVDQPHPLDVMMLRPEKEVKRGVVKEKRISVESVREALLFLGRFPIEGRYRVLIIDDAHRLSMTGQNALLKTLEEPNPSAVLILVTHETGALASTILSRVTRVRLDFVPEDQIREGVGEDLSHEALREVAPFFFALGRPGLILNARDNMGGFMQERDRLSRLFKISLLSLQERLALAEELSKDVPMATRLLEWWLPGLHASAQKSNEVRHTRRFFQILEMIQETIRLLKTTQSNARLLLEKLFLAI